MELFGKEIQASWLRRVCEGRAAPHSSRRRLQLSVYFLELRCSHVLGDHTAGRHKRMKVWMNPNFHFLTTSLGFISNYWHNWMMIQVLCEWHGQHWTHMIAMKKKISLTLYCLTVNPTIHWPPAYLPGHGKDLKTIWTFGTHLLWKRYSLSLFSRAWKQLYTHSKIRHLLRSHTKGNLHPYLRRTSQAASKIC